MAPEGLHVAERGRGPAVVMLHGFTGSSATWGPLLPALGERARVLALDLPGHGRSPLPGPGEGMDACVAQVLDALDARGVRDADLVGYSLGGRVALALALAAPGRVRRLVLLSASAGIEDPAQRAARRADDEALAARILAEGVGPFLDRWLAQPLFASLPPEVRARERALRSGAAPEGLAASLRSVGQGSVEPLWARLGEVRCPALLASGALDGPATIAMGRMAAAMPDARHVAVPGAGHAVHLEAPAAVAAQVRAFLAA